MHSKRRISERLNLNSWSLPILVEDTRTHPNPPKSSAENEKCKRIAVLYCNYHLYRNYSVNLYVIIQLPQVQWRSQFLAHVERERLLRSEACNQKPRRGPS